MMNLRLLLKNPFTLLIHVALAVILVGATLTHFLGIQGKVTLSVGETPVGRFEKSSGPGEGEFPFGMSLERVEVDYYPGTTTPMDYRSVVEIVGKDSRQQLTISMNRVGEADGWRFFQSGMGPESTTLSVSHDPVGTGVTYAGYILLGLGMAGFFFQRKSYWRSLFRRRVVAALVLLAAGSLAGMAAEKDLPAMQRPLARNFGKVLVYWDDRIVPIQTMAYDVTETLYGSRSYAGFTPEQVLSGWLFYYDDWARDYATRERKRGVKGEKKETERESLARWLGTGGAFRIYPYRSASGRIEWLSLTERRPSKMSLEQWQFIATSMSGINESLQMGRNRDADRQLSRLREAQAEYAGAENLPSESRIRAEMFYNRWVALPVGGVVLLVAGAWGCVVAFRRRGCGRVSGGILVGISCLGALWTGGILVLRGWIGGHWPLSNGPETMLFMAFMASAAAIFVRGAGIRSCLLLISGLTVMVAAMGGRGARIGALMPVLGSPLLSVHVMLVMGSYVIFLLMALLAVAALVKKGETGRQLSMVNRRLLVPGVFLLAAGIFVGAVWANQSWGRYWGWDPKETCALVTLLVYALPVHQVSLPVFRKDRVLNIYLAVAILSVAFTYFGANYLLPGLHSYA